MSNLFLRHGEVQNVKNIMYGDIPGYRLSLDGIKQARNAGKFINENFKIDKIITSPILRARETSKLVSEFLQVGIDISYNLYEWSGVTGWLGTTFDEFTKTKEALQALKEQLLSSSNPQYSPSGKKVIRELAPEDLESLL